MRDVLPVTTLRTFVKKPHPDRGVRIHGENLPFQARISSFLRRSTSRRDGVQAWDVQLDCTNFATLKRRGLALCFQHNLPHSHSNLDGSDVHYDF
jgi:hypothetical protein